ncbi:hypothetical protein [Luteirhabdus pelagi]|uniref:hypothetical protein n=1 Tax=Luteirhabdus pelagi TaxID=2792783 RepID=UPI0019395D01|nr:hypothetical protein [Luteirhabdus pelagi]MCT8340111.1 hypothetical protein [Thermobacterium salinum]
MASKRDFKRMLNDVIGSIIEAVYVWQITHPEKPTEDSEKIIDDAIILFDELIVKVNQRGLENPNKHFKQIDTELEERGRSLIDRINAL